MFEKTLVNLVKFKLLPLHDFKFQIPTAWGLNVPKIDNKFRGLQ